MFLAILICVILILLIKSLKISWIFIDNQSICYNIKLTITDKSNLLFEVSVIQDTALYVKQQRF